MKSAAKYLCQAFDAITQAPAPRGRATPAMLAHLLVSKYCGHPPLYRKSLFGNSL